VRAFGDTLWAWSENEIWRYSGSEWSIYATASTSFPYYLDMEYALDTLWVADGYRLQYYQGGVWQIVWQVVPGSPPVGLRIDVDDQSGIVWMTTGDNLYNWNGEEMTDVGHPSIPNIGDIAVTGDGFLWSSGWNPFVPRFGGLASYDDANSTWRWSDHGAMMRTCQPMTWQPLPREISGLS
jgi:ligand-binding sensor domain-containing protein